MCDLKENLTKDIFNGKKGKKLVKKGICDKLICPSRLYMYYVAKFFILRSTAAALHAAGYHDTNDALNAYKLWTSSPRREKRGSKAYFLFSSKITGKKQAIKHTLLPGFTVIKIRSRFWENLRTRVFEPYIFYLFSL